MEPCSACEAFSFKGSAVTVGEILRAAHTLGALEPSASQLAWEVACEDEADGAGLEADEASVDSMVEQFRYDRDLESAEETEAWLDMRGLTADDLQSYFTRLYWWKTLKEKVAPVPYEAERVDSELLDALAAELLISGGLVPLAVEFSRRLVARDGSETRVEPGLVEQERARFLERAGVGPEDLPGWLAALDRDQDWFDGMLEMEVKYRIRCDAALAPEQLSRGLAAARLPLTRLKIERVEFDTVDAAREALLCVRDDDLTLEDVARETRYPFERLEVYAEDLPDDQRQRFLCAKIGELQGPTPAEGMFRVSCLLARSEPALADPLVRLRIERRILNAHFSEAGAELVRWRIL